MGESVHIRAIEWLFNGKVGSSSKTILSQMLNIPFWGHRHPLDPDDFNRCVQLLELFPEYRPRLQQMSAVSLEWVPIVAYWNEIEQAVVEAYRVLSERGKMKEGEALWYAAYEIMNRARKGKLCPKT